MNNVAGSLLIICYHWDIYVELPFGLENTGLLWLTLRLSLNFCKGWAIYGMVRMAVKYASYFHQYQWTLSWCCRGWGWSGIWAGCSSSLWSFGLEEDSCFAFEVWWLYFIDKIVIFSFITNVYILAILIMNSSNRYPLK